MTREEFDRLYFDKAVHCDTKEKAKEFLALADSVGYRWFSGGSLIGRSYWETNEKETYYYITNDGLMFGNMNYIKQKDYQIIEYKLPPKFKIGDKVRIKDTIFAAFNGRVGVITATGSSNLMFHSVKVTCDEWSLWFNIKQLEKVEKPTYKEETVGDIIEEIKEYQEKITALLNRLEEEMKNK